MNKFWKRNENKILMILLSFSISIGLWNNFRQLWMQNNDLNVKEISQTLSFSTLLCVVGIIIFSRYIKLSYINKFVIIALSIKIIVLAVLYGINNTAFIQMILAYRLIYQRKNN